MWTVDAATTNDGTTTTTYDDALPIDDLEDFETWDDDAFGDPEENERDKTRDRHKLLERREKRRLRVETLRARRADRRRAARLRRHNNNGEDYDDDETEDQETTAGRNAQSAPGG